MAEIRRKEKGDESFIYVVLHNGMDKLFEEIEQFCKGEYGRACDLQKAYIAKKDPKNYPVKTHEFNGVGADLLERVRNHLQRARDFITFTFSANDKEFSLRIIPGSETEYLTRRMQKDDIEKLDESDTVVMFEDGEVDGVEAFLDNL